MLRPDRSDAYVVLGLACARPASYLFLWVALFVLTVSGEPIEDLANQLDSLEELFGAVFTPLVWVVAAVLLRVLVGWLAVFAAYPLTRRESIVEIMYRTPFREWQDRYFQTKAFVDLRRSWAVRQIAADRLGNTGVLLTRCAATIRWLNYVSFAGFVVAVTVRLA